MSRLRGITEHIWGDCEHDREKLLQCRENCAFYKEELKKLKEDHKANDCSAYVKKIDDLKTLLKSINDDYEDLKKDYLKRTEDTWDKDNEVLKSSISNFKAKCKLEYEAKLEEKSNEIEGLKRIIADYKIKVNSNMQSIDVEVFNKMQESNHYLKTQRNVAAKAAKKQRKEKRLYQKWFCELKKDHVELYRTLSQENINLKEQIVDLRANLAAFKTMQSMPLRDSFKCHIQVSKDGQIVKTP